MVEEKNAVEIREEDLEKVSGGYEGATPCGTEEKTDKAVFEPLSPYKNDDE